MKQTTNKLNRAFSSFLRNRMNLFYLLAFIPLLLIVSYQLEWPFGVVIPIYGFILLLLKKRNLSFRHEAGNIQRILGLLVILGSFFVYYALVPFFTSPSFYGSANYVVYIFGLFLTFYDISALKEAFTPIFLIVAATSSSFISNWLKPYFNPYIPHYISFIAVILNTLGIKATTSGQRIVLYKLNGALSMYFIWACVGVTSMLIFSTILVITLFEETASLKTKLAWAVIGLTGTFILNIVRITIIFIADYLYGYEVGGKVHSGIGYILFITWLAVFFYTFSKRQAILGKIRVIRQKLRPVTSRQ